MMGIWRTLGAAGLLAAGLLTTSPLTSARASGTPLASNPIKISINQEGIYRLTQPYLLSQNIDLTNVPNATLGLSDGSTPVPILVHSKSSTLFGTDPGDYLEFYAHPVNNTYGSTNVYELSDAVNSPARAPTSPIGTISSPATSGANTYVDLVRQVYTPFAPAGDPSVTEDSSWPSDGDPHWNHDVLVTDGSLPTTTRNWTFNLSGVVPSATNCQLTVSAYANPVSGNSFPPENELDFSINSVVVKNPLGGTQFIWPSPNFGVVTPYQAVATFPCSSLVSGANILTVNSTKQSSVNTELVYVQDFHVTDTANLCSSADKLIWNEAGAGSYQMGGFGQSPTSIWRVTSSGSTVLTGYTASTSLGGPCAAGTYSVQFGDNPGGAATYVATDAPLVPASIAPIDETNITSGGAGSAQYLIIANPLFLGSAPLQQMVTLETGQGMTVKVVSVDTILDQYGFGQPYPEAIRQYIQKVAVPNLGTKYVLLAGGDTYDYHNYFNCPSSNYCSSSNPNNLSLIPSMYTASTFAGPVPADHLFTVALGDGTDTPDVAIGRMPATSVAQFQIEVTKTVNWKAWSAAPGHLSTAIFGAGYEDSSFQSSSDTMASRLPTPFTVRKFYETGDPTFDQQNSVNFQAAFSNGPEVVNYMGHGNYTQWSNTPLFQTANVANLTNGDAPSMVFQWGCQATNYTIVDQPVGLNSALLDSVAQNTQPDGAVLAMGSTGADLAYQEEVLAGGQGETGPTGVHYFYGYLALNDSVGQALQFAGRDLMAMHPNDSDYTDVVNTYEVLGDPALALTTNPTAARVSSISAIRSGRATLVRWKLVAGSAIGFNLHAGSHAAALNHQLILARAGKKVYSARVQTSARSIRLEVIGLNGARWWYKVRVRHPGA